MTTPVALVFYEALLPGTQLVNRLQDLGYRVISHTDPTTLVAQAAGAKPFLMVMDLGGRTEVTSIIRELKANPDTAHIPVLAFAKDGQDDRRTAAREAGATLVAGDTAVLAHLPHLLQQVLEFEN